VQHITRYRYLKPVSHSHNEVRLMPTTDANQTCLVFNVTTDPEATVFHFDLPWGRVHHFDLIQPHVKLDITCEAVIETHRANPFEEMQLIEDDRSFYLLPDINEYYVDFLTPTLRVPILESTDIFAKQAYQQADSPATASFLIALTALLHSEFAYVPGSTTVDTPVPDVIRNRMGVCQDFAHLMLSICRRQQVPSRYVSGYLYTGIGKDSLVSGDASHAWVECLLPGGQWLGFDPTNNLVVNDKYVKVQHGRDYGDVPPLRGVYRGPAAQELDVHVRVSAEEAGELAGTI
jgi:transglutaminase-like putative cysteine protease